MSEREFVSFVLGGQSFAIPVHQVRDVLRPQPMTPIPLAPPAVAGLLNLRGRIVTAIELRTRLGLPARAPTEAATHVVVELSGELYALIADAAGDVIRLDDAALAPAPAALDPRWGEMVLGVHPQDDGFLVVLDAVRVADMTERDRAA